MQSIHSAEHTQCRAYTIQSIHSAEHTQCRAYTVQSIHSAEHTQCRAYTVQSIHSTEHTQYRAYTVQNIHSAEHTRTDSIRGSLSQGYSKTENEGEGGGGLYSATLLCRFAVNFNSTSSAMILDILLPFLLCTIRKKSLTANECVPYNRSHRLSRLVDDESRVHMFRSLCASTLVAIDMIPTQGIEKKWHV